MTAPDPGLTDLIAAHQLVSTDTIFHRNGMVQRPECKCGELMQWAGAYPAHLALVVEQHTNGRIAELEAELAEAKDDKFYARVELNADAQWKARAEKAEATIARVRAVESEYLDPEDTDIESREDVWRFIRDLRAALEGEQQ